MFKISDVDHETITKWTDLILGGGEFEANKWIESEVGK